TGDPPSAGTLKSWGIATRPTRSLADTLPESGWSVEVVMPTIGSAGPGVLFDPAKPVPSTSWAYRQRTESAISMRPPLRKKATVGTSWMWHPRTSRGVSTWSSVEMPRNQPEMSDPRTTTRDEVRAEM